MPINLKFWKMILLWYKKSHRPKFWYYITKISPVKKWYKKYQYPRKSDLMIWYYINDIISSKVCLLESSSQHMQSCLAFWFLVWYIIACTLAMKVHYIIKCRCFFKDLILPLWAMSPLKCCLLKRPQQSFQRSFFTFSNDVFSRAKCHDVILGLT
jgi:hypothetical protein